MRSHRTPLSFFSAASLPWKSENAGVGPEAGEVSVTHDYSLPDHKVWAPTGGPQDTCHVELRGMEFNGRQAGTAEGLRERPPKFNAMSVKRCNYAGLTSNSPLVATVAE